MITAKVFRILLLFFTLTDFSDEETATNAEDVNFNEETPSRDFLNITVKLFTRQNSKSSFLFNLGDSVEILSQSYFKLTADCKVVIPGWMSISDDPEYLQFIEALLIKGDFNVFMINWTKPQRHINYPVAAADCQQVANRTADFLKQINLRMNYSFIKLHLIGFSMGGQICGLVGDKLDGKIGRISGLDPASPLFENLPANQRLDHTDALFVDVIHTSCLGIHKLCGHVDFFPNDGLSQPKCSYFELLLTLLTGLVKWNILGMLDAFECSHNEAFYYYMNSINGNCSYEAEQCSSYFLYQLGWCSSYGGNDTYSYNVMGYHAHWSYSFPAKNGFYLNTNINSCI